MVAELPINYKNYPADWKQRRARILARENHCCKFCGVKNGAIGYRENDTWHQLADCLENAGMETETASLEGYKVIRIVLTIAHLNRTGIPGTPEGDGPLDCGDEFLAALCQSCHLRADKKRHMANRAANHRAKKARIQPSLMELV